MNMFASILRAHQKRYPEMGVQDLYKLAYQAALGPEHAVVDIPGAHDYLQRELESMGAGPPEPLLDPISGDGELVRVHLRPYMESGGDPGVLLDAFMRTANEYHGSTMDLETYWQAARQTGLWSLSAMDEFFTEMKTEGYSPVHHSEVYRRLYQPAYRVILRKLLRYPGVEA
jgi:hypothetical protein